MGLKARYDVLIAGAGASGLSLAYYLAQTRDFTGDILIVDKARKTENDRTWCFWGEIDFPFQQLIKKSWGYLSYCDEEAVVKRPVDTLGYHMIQGIDYYNFMYEVLSPLPNVDFYYGEIDGYEDTGEEVLTYVDGGKTVFRSRWMANSALRGNRRKDTARYHMIQHFQGYFIRTKEAKFDPDHAYLMDFRSDQKKHLNFFYVLPTSETEALVEYTIFSHALEKHAHYQEKLEAYIRDTLDVDAYEILDIERGAIPMTDTPFKRQVSERVVNIGTAGGAVKPTTGYAFVRILNQSKEVAGYIAGNQTALREMPYDRFRFYDQLLLWILSDYGDTRIGKSIFARLFRKNAMERILTFLSEKSTIGDDLRIFATLPIPLFLRAILGNIPRWWAIHAKKIHAKKQYRAPAAPAPQARTEHAEIAVNASGY